jgi:hypothetical protein
MPGTIIQQGRTGIVLPKAQRTATVTSDPFWLLSPGDAVLTLDISSLEDGQITQIEIQMRIGDSFKTIITIGSLTLNAVGKHAWLITKGDAAAGGWTGVIQGIVPERGCVKVTLAGGSEMVFGVKLGSLGQ